MASPPKVATFVIVAVLCFGLAHLVSNMLVSFWTPAFLVSHETRRSIGLFITVALGSYFIYATGRTQ